jgi:DNA-binding NarL/FixJ family response regulator
MIAVKVARPVAAISFAAITSLATVKAQVSSLLAKLELDNRVQIALLVHDADAG